MERARRNRFSALILRDPLLSASPKNGGPLANHQEKGETTMDFNALVDPLLRWAHVLSGICWIGLLYFFNFVNVPFQGKMDGPTKKLVNPELLPRALWWFRWAAMATLVFGLILFFYVYMHGKQMRLQTGEMSGRALYIMIGMTLGIIMWFNVWFVIWPTQKKIITAVKAGQAPDAAWGPRALKFSRFNAYASGPMLMFMIVAGHMAGAFSVAVTAVCFVVGLVAIFLAVNASKTVGSSI